MTPFWLATAAAALVAAIGATAAAAAATAGTTTTTTAAGRALCAEGRGRRAAPAASTAAATAGATEEESPAAGVRARPRRRPPPLAAFSAADLHRDCDIHRGGSPRESAGPEPAPRPLQSAGAHALFGPARSLAGPGVPAPRCVGSADGLSGRGRAGGAPRRSPLPLPPPSPPQSGKQPRLRHGLGSRRNGRGRWRQDQDAALPPGAGEAVPAGATAAPGHS